MSARRAVFNLVFLLTGSCILLAGAAASAQSLLASPTPIQTVPGTGSAISPSGAHQMAGPAGRPRVTLTENDLLSWVTLTDDQKSAIEQIHRSMRARMDIVAKDPNESPEQKSAMIQGLQRMQAQQVFQVLTHEQQEQIHKRIRQMRSSDLNSNRPATPPAGH